MLFGIDKFFKLKDTPKTYVGQAGKMCIVNGDESGITFGAAPAGVDAITSIVAGAYKKVTKISYDPTLNKLLITYEE